MTAAPRPTLPDGLEPGEGIRWTGSGVVLVDILAGRLLSAPDDPTAPLRTIAQLPVPLGAVAPLAGHLGTWVAGTGICLLHPDGTVDRLARLPARQPAGVCLAHDVLHITSARVGLAAPGREDGALFTARVDVPGTPTPACRLDRARQPAATGDPA
ncbi:hypothetical protein ACM01_04180 [Streptomyces viridochromogenes]|uniref:Uncharacterized protein n=1 Tax=Streptomyces viridochromogenes TaxID=1938 RepID=A0A0J7ZK57_STRVR|nr:hypothetical protein [Streptomyces viridochromogenes]KMS76411.1 hypothetical protein ACM01_04180 [Streptomyces viridochromogenes]KOG23189.1 hypothetical protein ADK35_12845 [Streptomyces viridochromogenes]KOG27207.1 hypothetical protein ADK36_01225 [Streptomyces viridochromogenes]